MKNLITKSDVKYIQSLAHKKFREEEGVFVIEGVKMVGELIDEFPDSIVHLYATQNWVDENRQQELASIPLSIIDEIHLLSDARGPVL
jgi:TrmH family RNA methyltransferase